MLSREGPEAAKRWGYYSSNIILINVTRKDNRKEFIQANISVQRYNFDKRYAQRQLERVNFQANISAHDKIHEENSYL